MKTYTSIYPQSSGSSATTSDGVLFGVHVKENKKTGRKDFISVFPKKPPKSKRPSAV